MARREGKFKLGDNETAKKPKKVSLGAKEKPKKKVTKSTSKGKTASVKKVAKLKNGKGRVAKKSTTNKPEEDPDTSHQDSPVPKRNKMMGLEEMQEFTKSIVEQFNQKLEQSNKTLTDTLNQTLKQEIDSVTTLKLDNITKKQEDAAIEAEQYKEKTEKRLKTLEEKVMQLEKNQGPSSNDKQATEVAVKKYVDNMPNDKSTKTSKVKSGRKGKIPSKK